METETLFRGASEAIRANKMILRHDQVLRMMNDEEERDREVEQTVANNDRTIASRRILVTRRSERSQKFERCGQRNSSADNNSGSFPFNSLGSTKRIKIFDAQQIQLSPFCRSAVLSACILLGTILLATGDCQALINEDDIPPSSGAHHPHPVSDDTAPPASLEGYDPHLAPPGNDSSSIQNQNGQQRVLKAINFTLVDEIFHSTLSNDEVSKRWKRMDSQLQDGMKAILKMIFPQIVSISQDAKVSGDCSGGILKWILSLRNLRSWAIKMLDATGKPTAGVFEGSLSMLGNYRQCLSIRAPDEDEIEISEQFEEYFRGQYCVLHLKPWMPTKRPFYHLNESFEFLLRKNYKYYEKTLYDELAEIAVAFNFVDIRMDLCVPSTCTVADIQRVAELLGKTLEMKAKVMRCDTASRDTISSFYQKLDQTTYIWLSIPLALITLSLISTLLVKLGFKSRTSRGLRQSHFSPSSSLADQQSNQSQSQSRNHNYNYNKQGKLFALFQSLSIGGQSFGGSNEAVGELSDNKLPVGCMNCNLRDDEADIIIQAPETLYGLRNLFVIWFIIVQMTVELKYQYLRESLQLRNMILTYWPFQLIINSALLFEALIVITAFLYSYNCIESSFKGLLGHLVNKYISLMLAIVTMIAITIITPMLAIESPIWRNLVEDQADVCKSTGYLDVFFLQNFISYDKICLPHTWLFCVELQLVLLVIPLMMGLRKNFCSLRDFSQSSNKVGLSLVRTILGQLFGSNAGLLAILLIIIGYCVNFVLVYAHQLPPSWFYSFPDPDHKHYYFTKYLTKTWTHLSSFIIGLLAGHVSRSHIQLKANQQLQHRQQQPENNSGHSSSNGPNQSSPHMSHGSTSTIMAMEMSQVNLQASSSGVKRLFVRRDTLVGTLLVLVMMLVIVSTFTWSTQIGPAPHVAAAYDATSRVVWSLALSVIMFFLCQQKHSNESNLAGRLLMHPLSLYLGKICSMAYLVAPYVNTLVLAAQEQSLFPSMFMMFHVIFGNIAIIYTLALILATVIERPVRRFVNLV